MVCGSCFSSSPLSFFLAVGALSSLPCSGGPVLSSGSGWTPCWHWPQRTQCEFFECFAAASSCFWLCLACFALFLPFLKRSLPPPVPSPPLLPPFPPPPSLSLALCLSLSLPPYCRGPGPVRSRPVKKRSIRSSSRTHRAALCPLCQICQAHVWGCLGMFQLTSTLAAVLRSKWRRASSSRS